MKKDIILLKKKMDELGVVSKSVVGGGAIASGSGGQRERPAHGGYKGEEGGRPPQGREKKQLREEAQGSGQEGARALPKMAWAATGEDELIGGDGITPSGPPQSPLKDEVMGASTALRGLPYFNLTKTVADDPDSVVEEVFKTACPAGCSDHGTCIEPEGWCNCPVGRTGPSCSELSLAACRVSEAPNATMYCGIKGVKNCECFRQCRADESKYHVYKPKKSCFEYNDVPMEKQLSQVPLPGAQVTWYKTLDKREGVESDPAKKSRRSAPPGAEWVNAKLCPGHCNERGMCYRRGQNSPECRCYWGYKGPDCSNQREDSCFHACSGHGQCIGGFCKCDPGHWGIDCSSNLCPKEESYRGPLANKPFKIFVYELPTRIAYRSEIDVNPGQQGHDGIDGIYMAYKLFLKQLLHDCSVRTRDPAEADLFYVPAFTYGWSANLGKPEPQLARVIEHLKKTSPWFRRNKGRDHMVFLPQDRGMCQRYWPHSDTVMMMGFWGAQKPGTREQMQHGYGGEDRKLHQATMFLKSCYDPLKDVVVPPYNIQYKKQAQLYYADWKLPGPDGKGGVWGKGVEGRRHTFMFAGGLRPVLQYSQGIRQEVFKHLKHTPGFEVAERLPNAMQSMMQSKYCGVFTGHGWGIRIVQVSANGCIPVVIQDWVTQPLEEVVPFWSFALRFSRQQIKDLPRLLGEIPESRLRSMQMQQFRYHQVFSWDADTGKAYEYTLRLLRRKAEHRSWHRALPEKPSLRSGGSARGKKAARDDSEQGKRKSRAVPAVPGRSPRKGSSRAARTSRMPSGAGLVHFPKH